MSFPFTTEMFSFSESADFLDFLLFFLVPDFSDFSIALFSVLVMISSAPLLSARSTLDCKMWENKTEDKRESKDLSSNCVRVALWVFCEMKQIRNWSRNERTNNNT